LTVGVSTFAVIALLGLLHGGYFSTAWGWGSLACLWAALVLLVVSDRVEIGRLEIVFLTALSAFLAWTALSASWSVASPSAIREVERGLLLWSALVTTMLLVRRRMRPLLGGVLGGIVIACGYGLATRLFPVRLGSFSAIAGYRLDEPLGYWNAIGLFAAMGTLLATGFAARGRGRATRAFGSAAPIVLVPTLYFTYSRGGWAALGIGLGIAVALDRRRLQLLSTILALSPIVALAVWFCAREPDLNRRTAALSDAAAEGRRLAFILVALAIASACVGPALQVVEQRAQLGRRVRIAWGGLVIAVLLAGVGAGVVHYGGPHHVATRAYDSFKAQPVRVSASGNLNQRLFTFSANGRLTQWRVAVDDYRKHPWLGSGAGTYELSWLHDRPTGLWKIRDAHNLYVEVLAELGPVGLALLLLTLSVPIYAAVKVRRHPLVPIAFGAYVAFLLHAAVDWDWEMPALTIAGLLCGVAIMVVARQSSEGRLLSRGIRIPAVTAILSLAAFAFVGLMGNLAIASSNNAKRDGNWARAEQRAGDAKRWMPWSSVPWILQGEAQYVQRKDAAARANFDTAREKDPNNWLVWADLATVSPHGAWRAPGRRALELNPLAPELGDIRKALGAKG
jgi:O-antigen ligase